MSWSEYLPDVDVDAVKSAEPSNENTERSRDQFDAAQAAAAAIVESGVVGDPSSHRFNVSLAGHANPGHEPAEGWSNDTLSVSVSQLS